MSNRQIARRWRLCNPQAPSPFSNLEDEDEWRSSVLELLSKAHTLGGINELSFEVVESHYSDMAFQLECDSFRWKWETCFVGHKLSSEIISKQLILPLIDTNYLLYSSTESVKDMTNIEVENAVDRIGRTARRSIDTHIKNSLSKPRISTILRRMTAVLNSLHELPGIISTAEEPDLRVQRAPTQTFQDSRPTEYTHLTSVVAEQPRSRSSMPVSPPPARKLSTPVSPAKADSATESSADEKQPNISLQPPHARNSPQIATNSRASSAQKRSLSPVPSRTKTPEQHSDQASDDDSSPVRRPLKKAKAARAVSDESDSESEKKAGGSQLKSNAGGSRMGGGTQRRGPRQPVKRGGKKF
ncbi:hypothetical protein AGABI1DRAFT_121142 [Agaricus bisporus var. burnettii JB137-S8]|uniref:Uncharacterized protein n=1 Tax=Agaricus bisporus var. burnettii (strain JB137-S8 / ATCC MYA-4627 / FGSC 10392) TaxID=597362 RepID=K5X6X2_AGABU|nr:uncharacterized protein AGABI1DRAFT_121142 [Agaricus bisporus var. burnettii JB137-S8]EKM78712.1 hypothetical protein AGABI1DRAFT_121142 [Agaricus bisporus var. burnettii JB137-S8]